MSSSVPSWLQRLLLTTGVLLFTALDADESAAFCRTTTCDATVSCETHPEDCCRRDAEGCDTAGLPVFWPNTCVSYSVQEDGSRRLGITAKELSSVLDSAFDSWISAECPDGSSVGLGVDARGFAECATPEFNQGSLPPNANIWMFNDIKDGERQPSGIRLDATTLAITLLTFEIETGALLDADTELYSGRAHFTVGDSDVDIDLASVVTHEAGHFLGLDHSLALSSTMSFDYLPGDIGPRFLTADDVEGICSVYPEDREITHNSCEPHGQYATHCAEDAPDDGAPEPTRGDNAGGGCHTSANPGPSRERAPLVGALCLYLLSRRRRPFHPPSNPAALSSQSEQ